MARKMGILKRFKKLSLLVRIGAFIALFFGVRWLMNKYLTGKEGFSNSGNKFVLFHMNKCGYCKQMMPEWDKFASSYNGDVEIKKIEASSGNPLLNKHGVDSYPTIMLLDKNGNKVKDYDGERTASAFKSFLN